MVPKHWRDTKADKVIQTWLSIADANVWATHATNENFAECARIFTSDDPKRSDRGPCWSE